MNWLLDDKKSKAMQYTLKKKSLTCGFYAFLTT